MNAVDWVVLIAQNEDIGMVMSGFVVCGRRRLCEICKKIMIVTRLPPPPPQCENRRIR